MLIANLQQWLWWLNLSERGPSLDARIWRLLNELQTYNEDNIGIMYIQMKREELTETFGMISNFKHPLVSMFVCKYFSALRV